MPTSPLTTVRQQLSEEADLRIKPMCRTCGDYYSPKRRKLGYEICTQCGEEESRRTRHTIAPLHKSNYIFIANPADLIGINLKQR